MKVKFSNENINGICVKDLGIGKTFCDHRRSNPDEMALYMIVDNNNAYVNKTKLTATSYHPYTTYSPLAINLATGQLKAYRPNDKVFPVDVEINVPRF